MRRKSVLIFTCMLLTAMFGGCSKDPADSADPAASAESTQTVTEALDVSKNMYYITDHGTTDTADLESFRTQLEADGFSWNEITLAEIPLDADGVIFNAPKEDITKEEMDALDAYMDEGGHLLLLLPAYEEEVRFKYLSRFLETYCITFGYNRISETDSARMVNNDPFHVQTNYIAHPENMPLYSSAQDNGIVYLHDARSFKFMYQDYFSVVKQDVMLQTAASAEAAPYGGVEDDPITIEDTAIDVMGYARNETRLNSSIVYVGASDFLCDDNYNTDTAAAAVAWVHSSLYWFVQY